METLFYNLQDPPQWDPQPEDLPSDSGAVLVMRHSVRYPMVAGQFGTQIELTPTGIERETILEELGATASKKSPAVHPFDVSKLVSKSSSEQG